MNTSKKTITQHQPHLLYKEDIILQKLKETIEILSDNKVTLPSNEEEFQSFSLALNELAFKKIEENQKLATLSLSLVNFNKGDFNITANTDKNHPNKELYNLEQGLLTLGKTLTSKTLHISKIEEIFNAIDIAFCTYEVLERKVSNLNPAFSSFFDFKDTFLKSIPSHLFFDKNLTKELDDFYTSSLDSKTFIFDFFTPSLQKTVVHVTKLKTLSNSNSTISIFITDISDKIENAYLTKENTIKTKQLVQKEELITQMINEFMPGIEKLEQIFQSEKWNGSMSENLRVEFQSIFSKISKSKRSLENLNTIVNIESIQNKEFVNIKNTLQTIVNKLSEKALLKNIFLDLKTSYLEKEEYVFSTKNLESILNNLIFHAIENSEKNNSIVIESNLLKTDTKAHQFDFKISFHRNKFKEFKQFEETDKLTMDILTVTKLLLKNGSALQTHISDTDLVTYNFVLILE